MYGIVVPEILLDGTLMVKNYGSVSDSPNAPLEGINVPQS